MDDVVVPPLKTIQGLFAVTQEMAEGAGRGGTERALGVHYLLPFGQVIGACQAVSGGSGRPGHDPLGDGKDEALPRDILLLLSQQAGKSTLTLELVGLCVGLLYKDLRSQFFPTALTFFVCNLLVWTFGQLSLNGMAVVWLIWLKIV